MTVAPELQEQQINLLSAELLPRRVVLPVRHMAAVLLLTLAMMGLLVMQTQMKTSHLRDTSALLDGQQRQLNQKLAQLASASKPPEADPALLAQALALEKRLTHQRTLLAELDEIARPSALTPWLSRLAEQRPTGLWLDELHHARGGADQWISGWVRDPADLTRWTEQLTKAAAASAVAYQRLSLNREAQGSFRFVLAAGCLAIGRANPATAATTASSPSTSQESAATACVEQQP
jgi:Tfp pilus assembly protein PilN